MIRRLAAAAAFVCVLAPAADAREATLSEVRELAARATSDETALRELRTIDRVDGRPVDIDAALRGARGRALDERLRTLAGTPVTSNARARDTAREILRERRFRAAGMPRPFARPIHRAGAWVERLLDRIPGPRNFAWFLLGAAVVCVASIVAIVLGRRRTAVIGRHVEQRRRLRGDDPDRLEHEASDAERAGDHATAVRLRFRAGLLRLDKLGAITYRPSITTGAVKRRIRVASFAGVAKAFEEIAYGGRPAGAGDSAGAREGWTRVLQEVGSPL